MLTIMLMGMFDLLCLVAWLILAVGAIAQMEMALALGFLSVRGTTEGLDK